MKIYIIGTGGVGGYFGGKLALVDGQDVTFVARGANYEAIKANGLKVNTTDGELIINPANVIQDFSEIVEPDLIMFCVKTYDSEAVARELNDYVKPETVVISFQNGIQNDLVIKKQLKNCPVFPGVAYVISSKHAPGVITQNGGRKKLFFGARAETKVSAATKLIFKEFETICHNAGIDATLSEDIASDIWRKFVFISAFSGMTALCRSCIGIIREDDFTAAVYSDCLKEAIAVAKALKVDLPKNIFDEALDTTLNKTEYSSKSSLLLDIENKRRNEIEVLNGALVRLARENNVEVPINKAIYAAIKLL